MKKRRARSEKTKVKLPSCSKGLKFQRALIKVCWADIVGTGAKERMGYEDDRLMLCDVTSLSETLTAEGNDRKIEPINRDIYSKDD